MKEVIFKGSQGVYRLPAETANLDQRIIYLDGEISSESANDFIRQLLFLGYQDPYLPVKVLINSPGGSVSAGMSIIDAIEGSSMPIETVCIEKAYSMAALIMASGAKRLMLPHSTMMLHRPWIDGHLHLNQGDVLALAENMNEQEKEVIELLSHLCKKSPEEIREAIGFEHYFDASEAIAFGLADRVFALKEMWEG